MNIQIKNFNFRNATQAEYSAFNEFNNKINQELFPEEKPRSLEEMILSLQNYPVYNEFIFSVVECKNTKKIIGYSQISFSREDNLHLLYFNINILPEFRRQGIGKKLFSKIVDFARKENRNTIMTNTFSTCLAGEEFISKTGAEKVLDINTKRLVIQNIEPNLLSKLKEKSKQIQENFEIEFLEGKFNDENLKSIADLYNLISNSQYLGDIDMEFKYTPEHLRMNEKYLFSTGLIRWVMFVKEKQSGNIIGLTEVTQNPNKSDKINQVFTGILNEYQNKGLGSWLKLSMLEKIIKEKNEIKFIHTDNALKNAPIDKINKELGFESFMNGGVWSIKTETAFQSLH